MGINRFVFFQICYKNRYMKSSDRKYMSWRKLEEMGFSLGDMLILKEYQENRVRKPAIFSLE